MALGLDGSRWLFRQGRSPRLYIFEAIAQADRLSRPMAMSTRSVNLATMTKPHCYRMLNSKQEVKMEMLLVDHLFQ